VQSLASPPQHSSPSSSRVLYVFSVFSSFSAGGITLAEQHFGRASFFFARPDKSRRSLPVGNATFLEFSSSSSQERTLQRFLVALGSASVLEIDVTKVTAGCIRHQCFDFQFFAPKITNAQRSVVFRAQYDVILDARRVLRSARFFLSLTLSCSYRYRCVSLRSLGFRILCQRFTKDFFRFLNSAPNCNITKTASCTTSASASCTAIFYGFCSVVWGYLARRPFDAGHLRCGQRLRRESSLHIVYAVDCAVGFWTSLRSLLLTSAEQISG